MVTKRPSVRLFAAMCRVIALTCLAGAVAATIVGIIFGTLQYAELQRHLVIEKRARLFTHFLNYTALSTVLKPQPNLTVIFDNYLEREVRRGSLLIFAQMGVLGAVLYGLVEHTARQYSLRMSILFGAGCGTGVAVVLGILGIIWRMPLFYLGPLCLVPIIVGTSAGYIASYVGSPLTTSVASPIQSPDKG